MNYLEHHRRKRGLTILEACKIVGVSYCTWRHYEQKRTYPNRRRVQREIREAFETWAGVSWQTLMEKVR